MKLTRQFLDLLPDSPLTLGLVDDLERECPWFTLPAVLILQQDNRQPFLNRADRERLMARLALNASDPATLMALVEPDGDRFVNFYPTDVPVKKTTEEAIDLYLDTYGQGASSPASDRETALLERLIFNPVAPDYISLLEQEARPVTPEKDAPAPEMPAGVDETTARIDAFLASRPAPDAVDDIIEVPAVQEPSRDREEKAVHGPKPSVSSLSESLAVIYIRQGKYEKAYEIMSNVVKSHPDTQPFAEDRLRFLRKAILARGGKIS